MSVSDPLALVIVGALSSGGTAIATHLVDGWLAGKRAERESKKSKEKDAQKFIKDQFDNFLVFFGACSTMISGQKLLSALEEGQINSTEFRKGILGEFKEFRSKLNELMSSGRTFLLPKEIDQQLAGIRNEVLMGEWTASIFSTKLDDTQFLNASTQILSSLVPRTEKLRLSFQKLLNLENLNVLLEAVDEAEDTP